METLSIGEKIKNKRLEKKLSQRELASICNMSYSNLNKIENGKITPTVETLMKLSKVLGDGLIGTHMAHMKNSTIDNGLHEYVKELSKQDFNVFYGLVEHICEYYCDGQIDPKILLENNHSNYDDLRDLLIDVIKSRLNYYVKNSNK